MASILMGTITALIVILIGGGSFYVGYKVGYANLKTEQQEEKKAELTEEQRRVAEGLANIFDYSNRHKAGGVK